MNAKQRNTAILATLMVSGVVFFPLWRVDPSESIIFEHKTYVNTIQDENAVSEMRLLGGRVTTSQARHILFWPPSRLAAGEVVGPDFERMLLESLALLVPAVILVFTFRTGPHQMNLRQKTAMIVGALAVSVVLFFPTWRFEHDPVEVSYAVVDVETFRTLESTFDSISTMVDYRLTWTTRVRYFLFWPPTPYVVSKSTYDGMDRIALGGLTLDYRRTLVEGLAVLVFLAIAVMCTRTRPRQFSIDLGPVVEDD